MIPGVVLAVLGAAAVGAMARYLLCLALEGKRAHALANVVVTLIAGILAASSFFALTLLVVS